MQFDVSSIAKQIDQLEAKRAEMRKRSQYDDLCDLPESEIAGLVTLQLQLIDRFAPVGSAFRKAADTWFETYKMGSLPYSQKHYAGILSALKTAYTEQDYFANVQELVHADVFGDLLEMADHLVSEGYKDAAAVTAGGVLEEGIRKLATKLNVPVADAAGKPKKTSLLNDELVKAGAYNLLEQKSVTAWLDLRNKAAHGLYSEYDENQVQQFIAGIREFLIRHPA